MQTLFMDHLLCFFFNLQFLKRHFTFPMANNQAIVEVEMKVEKEIFVSVSQMGLSFSISLKLRLVREMTILLEKMNNFC
jgi:hypothetical protein